MLLHVPSRSICFPFLPRQNPPSPSVVFIHHQSSRANPRRMSAVRSSAVEHIVLFDVKPETEPEKVEAMLSGVRSLSSLDSVISLTAGPITDLRSSFGFTHLLHSRYPTKQALDAYSAHPSHLAVVRESLLPISRDLMDVDWVTDVEAIAPPSAAAAFRLTLVKPHADLDRETRQTIRNVLEGVKSSIPSAIEVSFGENFSHARAKGFEWCLISFFSGVEDLNAVGSKEEHARALKERVRDLVDEVIVIDYELPNVQRTQSPTTTNL